MEAKQIKLSARLQAVASLVKKGSRVADVGTDHGYVPVYLMQNKICETVIAADINRGPLNKAVESAEIYGVSDQIQFILTDGLIGITKDDANTVIIAGMGGETIISILSAAPWVTDDDVDLILQPQSKIDELTAWLYEHDLAINYARLVKDDGKLYVIMSIATGKQERENAKNAVLEALLVHNDPLLYEYIEMNVQKLNHALHGLLSSRSDRSAELQVVQKRLDDYETYMKRCK